MCERERIGLGSLRAVGAVNRVKLGLFKTAEKQYVSKELEGDYEIASLYGNISAMNGKPYLHIHAVVTDESLSAYGGHLNSAIVSATCEILLDSLDGCVEREYSEEIGLNLYKFL